MDLKALFSRRLIMVTGKGGIGKTLVSAALAREAVRAGKRVCVVEAAAQDQLGPLFGLAPVGHNLTAVGPNLFTINLNPQDNFRDFVVVHLGYKHLFEKIFTKSIVSSFIRMIPGISELTLLGRLFYYAELCKEPAFDLVILDGYASGHFLSLMLTPDAILTSGLVGPIVAETKRVRDYIHNEAMTALVQVTMAEELIVGESLEFLERFNRETKLKFNTLLVNRAALPVLKPSDCEAFTQGAPQLKPLTDYLLKRQERYNRNFATLVKGLAEIKWHGDRPELHSLPEVGAVPEPLSQAFVAKWLGQAEEENLA